MPAMCLSRRAERAGSLSQVPERFRTLIYPASFQSCRILVAPPTDGEDKAKYDIVFTCPPGPALSPSQILRVFATAPRFKLKHSMKLLCWRRRRSKEQDCGPSVCPRSRDSESKRRSLCPDEEGA